METKIIQTNIMDFLYSLSDASSVPFMPEDALFHGWHEREMEKQDQYTILMEINKLLASKDPCCVILKETIEYEFYVDYASGGIQKRAFKI